MWEQPELGLNHLQFVICPNVKYPTWRLQYKNIFVIVPNYKIRYTDTNRKKISLNENKNHLSTGILLTVKYISL